jgi:glutamate--cysteine ligase
MSLDRRGGVSSPVTGIEDLIAWMRGHERPESEWKVGLEHEKMGLVAGTCDPVAYDGPGGVARLLRGFARFGYSPFEEGERVIASQHSGLTVSIEPGGQLELSGRPFKELHLIAAELDRHLEKCHTLTAELGIELLAVGYRPWGTPASACWMPKERYRVMRPFLEGRGRHAADMMAMTGSTQVSFDFGSERDLAEKLRVALAVQPAVAALYANSPIVNGSESGWKSFRIEVWNHVDPARCGLLPFVFEEGFELDAYRRYVEWALDVPMIFLRRRGRYLETGGRSFRAFLAGGLEGERPTLTDWEDHLTAVFPEVRVKSVIEVRGADACDRSMTSALAALWKGILYSRESRQQAWAAVAGLRLEERRALMTAAGREGLAARLPGGRSLRELAGELVEAAAAGLRRQRCSGERGDDEQRWLEPLAERVERGRSPADDALEVFRRSGAPALAAHLRIA